jgi:hypothetical protein
MNKGGVVILGLFIYIIFTVSFGNTADPVLNVSVNILEPPQHVLRVEISPDNINLGNILPGYNSNYSNITFTNKGDLKAIIYPKLNSNHDDVFNYLEFNTASCSPTSTVWHNISYYLNESNKFLIINKPSTLGGERIDNACIRLRLEDYDNPISPGLKSTQITFLVMSDE